MSFYLSIPVLFLRFWFIDSPIRLTRFFFSVNHAMLQILSLPVLIRTFFKPLKNEYRKGLVVFSIVFGMILKSTLIFVDSIVFLFALFVEVAAIVIFVLLPFLTFYVLTI